MHLEWWQEYVTFYYRREICYLDFKQFTIAASLLFYIILFWIAVIINGNRHKRILLYSTNTAICDQHVVIFPIKAHLILKCVSTENINSLRVYKFVYGILFLVGKLHTCTPHKQKQKQKTKQNKNKTNTSSPPVLIIHYTSEE
jgi:hypothetical protein